MGAGVKVQAALFNIYLVESPQVNAIFVYVFPHNDVTTVIGFTSEDLCTDPHDTQV